MEHKFSFLSSILEQEAALKVQHIGYKAKRLLYLLKRSFLINLLIDFGTALLLKRARQRLSSSSVN